MLRNNYLRLMALTLLLSACTGKPDGMVAVNAFEINRYLGTWYEIARLDHSFERGLDNVSAEYSLRDDGGINVINRGFSREDREWQEADGKAYFVINPDTGHLKVSFFGPFYGSYVIFGLDSQNYQYSFVSGPTTDYLWLLARTPEIDQDIIEQFIKQSKAYGFDTGKLIFVSHDQSVR